MAKPINPLAYRLGYSKFWILNTNIFRNFFSFKNQYFIVQWLQNFCKKLNIFVLDVNIFENNQGNIFVNILSLFFNHNKNFQWNRFTFIIKKWLNIWFFRQPWNKKHKLWIQNRRNIEKLPIYINIRKKYLISFFFHKLLFYKLSWLFSNKLKKKVIVNIKNFRWIFKLENESFINLLVDTLIIKSGVLQKRRSTTTDNIIFFLTLAVFLKNSKLIGLIISKQLEISRKHALTLRFLNTIILLIMQRTFGILFNSLIFQVKGKINAVDRKIKKIFKFGKTIAVQTKRKNINYNFTEAFTFTGVFSIKTWIY